MRSLRNLAATVIDTALLRLLLRRKVTPHNFHNFTYSKRSHFQSLCRHKDHLHENINECNLKIYQDMLAYNFILDNFPQGARLLEIGGGDSRVISWLKHRYEFWNLDKLEGVGNGVTDIPETAGFRLIRDYIGSFSEELMDGYFDGIFSVSVLEHVPTDQATMGAIRDDIQRLLKPGGLSLHCIDAVLKSTQIKIHPLVQYFYDVEEIINPFVCEEDIRNDPDLWGMSEFAYNKFWAGACKNLDYESFGIPISYNLLWRKAK